MGGCCVLAKGVGWLRELLRGEGDGGVHSERFLFVNEGVEGWFGLLNGVGEQVL